MIRAGEQRSHGTFLSSSRNSSNRRRCKSHAVAGWVGETLRD
jgi:hypothetical protein